MLFEWFATWVDWWPGSCLVNSNELVLGFVDMSFVTAACVRINQSKMPIRLTFLPLAACWPFYSLVWAVSLRQLWCLMPLVVLPCIILCCIPYSINPRKLTGRMLTKRPFFTVLLGYHWSSALVPWASARVQPFLKCSPYFSQSSSTRYSNFQQVRNFTCFHVHTLLTLSILSSMALFKRQVHPNCWKGKLMTLWKGIGICRGFF